MASQEDTDDLYADLYGADVAGEGSGEGDDQAHAGDEQDLIGYEEDDQKNGDSAAKAADDKPAATASTTSFIPAASSAPTQQGDAGLQIKGSFIPPPAAASSAAHSHSDVRDLTPASHNDASSNQQSASQHVHGAGDGGEGQNGGSDDRSVMPHEMPEEGKMFVGGLNWDTTEDSLRRYFSQFGEVGNCTIMRDNMTGRSRGFAFLNFIDPKAVNTVMVREHYLDGKVIDPKRAIPRSQRDQSGGYAQNNYNNNNNNYNNGGGGGNYSAANQKLFVGGLPPTVTPVTFRTFFEQFGPLSECTCMMDRETGNPRGFGFLTYADDASLHAVLNTRPIVFEGKEVDVKRAQSKNDPQSLQIRRQQRNDDPSTAHGMQQFGGGGGRYNNNYNAAGASGNNAWQMNPMMMGMGVDMSQMYQNWGGGNGWNPQMAWQQMMATMAAQNGGAGGGMDMSAMMGGMMGGGMGMMGGMGSMSPPSNMSPSVSSAVPTGPAKGGDGQGDRAGRFQRGGSQSNGIGRAPPTGPRGDRERSPGGGGHRRERSPDRRDQNRRYEGQRNR